MDKPMQKEKMRLMMNLFPSPITVKKTAIIKLNSSVYKRDVTTDFLVITLISDFIVKVSGVS